MRGARPEGGVEPWVQFPLGVAARGRDLGAEPEPSVIFCWGGAWGRGGRRWLVGARRGAWHRALLVGWRRRGVAKGHRWLVSARGGAWRGGAVGWSWCAGAMGGRGGGGGMALLLCLSLTVALARGCLHCHSNFSDKFNFYRDHVNLKSWWVGDIPVSGSLLTDWSQDTMNELHLAIPAEITREKLDQVANAVYQKMDVLYQGKMYFPGRIDCQRHCGECASVQAVGDGGGGSVGPRRPRGARRGLSCVAGVFQYQTISCSNCTDSHVVCFGYNCESSAQWEMAVQGLLRYINIWHKQNTKTRTTPAFLVSPSFTCLEPPNLANLTLEDASECLMQH
ncbi:izumo sperm-egg fusion protein 4 isoform X3 [Equus quagga]|uniref:izumo sperm-egg fusion protein 4 isoform X3 n=1 Tax=Equus quagga TaxID=89248 RepID=UPI001EE29C16|nr:izumo sperm-egg fusion protein 4 isoform X3 [Equus quagga]